jgi:hypothetical protein
LLSEYSGKYILGKEYKEMDKEEFRLWLRYHHLSKSRW